MSDAARQFRQRFSGIGMLARALQGTTVALQTKQDFDRLIELLRLEYKSLRTGEFNLDAKDTKAAKKMILREMEPQAIRFALNLQRRVLSPKHGPQTIHFLQGWIDKFRGKPLSQKQAEESLLQALSQDFIDTPSDGVTRQMLEAIERGKYTRGADDDWPSAGGLARLKDGTEEWTHQLMPSALAKQMSGNQFLPTKDFDEKLQSAMDHYGRTLGDRDSDLLMFAMQRYTERAKKPGDLVALTIDELTDALFPKHEGGGGGESHRVDNKRYVRDRFERLADGFLSIHKAVKPSKTSTKTMSIQSQVLMIEDRVGQADFDGRVTEWQSVHIRFGQAWAYRLFEPGGKLTAAIQARALRYNPDKERFEKRLLKRLGFFWRMNMHTSTARRSVADWLRQDIGEPRFNEIDMSFDRREAERLELAFNRLQADSEIAGWRYADGEPTILEMGSRRLQHGWREAWLSRELVVEAPGAVKAFYAEHRAAAVEVKAKAKALPTPEKAPEASLGARFRACRRVRGITGLQAAAEAGISNSALSRIENGKAEPTKAQAEAMAAWIDKVPVSN